MQGWGVEENGALWSCAYETVMDAASELAERVCELANMDGKAKGAAQEWTFRIVRVNIEKK